MPSAQGCWERYGVGTLTKSPSLRTARLLADLLVLLPLVINDEWATTNHRLGPPFHGAASVGMRTSDSVLSLFMKAHATGLIAFPGFQ